MSHKRCIFLDCHNTGAGDITLFSFPKEAARQKRWLELAGRANYTLQKSDCLCESHFGNQFISSNQRRKVLVGVALPFSFDQSENDEEQQIESLDERLDDLNQMFEDDELQEDMDSYSSNSIVEHAVGEYSPETIVCDTSERQENHVKRKIMSLPNMHQNGSEQHRKLMKFEMNSCNFKNGQDPIRSYARKDEIKIKPHLPAIIDHPDVSIFNIRGEEFIQMPKAVYLEEKQKLENVQQSCYIGEINKLKEEVEIYKNIMLSIKNELKNVP